MKKLILIAISLVISVIVIAGNNNNKKRSIFATPQQISVFKAAKTLSDTIYCVTYESTNISLKITKINGYKLTREQSEKVSKEVANKLKK